MDNVYTEPMLKKLNKEGLTKIAADNGIEIPEGATNPKIIELILGKGCPLPESAPGGDDAADTSSANGEPAGDDNPKFDKEYFLKSNWYSHKRDVLNATLDDGKQYSVAAVERLIAKSGK